MKREILFRGWTIGEFTWEYGFLSWADTPRGRAYFINNKRVDERTVGQFTGITDKNGIKIFEGDILLEKGKVNNGDTGAINVESKRIVSIENAADGYMCIVSNYRSLVHHQTIEVIGNIHDNKELIK